jgi:hypothetical protein
MDPNRTLSPADKMTAAEWHEARADRCIKEALYTALAERLAHLDAVDLAVDMAVSGELHHLPARCGSCDGPIAGVGLCPICRAWATSVEARLNDREAMRKLKVQLAATELMEMLRVTPMSDLHSEKLHRIDLTPYETSVFEAYTGGA